MRYIRVSACYLMYQGHAMSFSFEEKFRPSLYLLPDTRCLSTGNAKQASEWRRLQSMGSFQKGWLHIFKLNQGSHKVCLLFMAGYRVNESGSRPTFFSSFPAAFKLSQHYCLFQRILPSHDVSKVGQAQFHNFPLQ